MDSGDPPASTDSSKGWRHQLHEIIFEADTPAGRWFDVALLWCILISVIAVIIETVAAVREHPRIGYSLEILEWIFTVLFTIEYGLRILCVKRPLGYVFSYYGVIDLLAVLPTYVAAFVTTSNAQTLLVIRILRLVRVFRVFKMGRFVRQGNVLKAALRASRTKITLFIFVVFNLVVIIGALMYAIEGEEHGFTSIPVAMYWTIVTITTVGYGDIVPQTVAGQVIASVAMLLGYAIIAVPTGIVSVEIAEATRLSPVSTQACPSCAREGHSSDAVCCKFCGEKL